MSEPDYLPKNLKLEWLTDICSVCGKEYPYLLGQKTGHCGRFDCLYELAIERLKEKEAKIK